MDATPGAVISSAYVETAATRSGNRPIARWVVAIIMVVYGFAKLNGSQFTVLDSELDRPMGDVSGFWLTWHYFSYSPVYGNLIAVIQIIGGLLVTQRRFALAGALLLLPVTLNIILVDMFYGIGIGPMLTAVLLLGLLVRIVAPHARPILDAVVPSHTRGNAKVSTFIAPLALVIAAFGFTYWVANYNNRVPTAIDGVWTVQAAAGADSLERAFFERNRAHMVVLKDASGVYRQHHFELEPDGRLRIWETWLTKGPLQYEGMFTPPDRIRLHRAAESGDGIVELQRLPHAWRVD